MRKKARIPTRDLDLVKAWAEQENCEAYPDGSSIMVEGDEGDVAEIESRWLKYLRAREALERIGVL